MLTSDFNKIENTTQDGKKERSNSEMLQTEMRMKEMYRDIATFVEKET